MDQSQNASHQAGQAMGQARVSCSTYTHVFNIFMPFNFLHIILNYSGIIARNNVITDLGEGKQHDEQCRQCCSICQRILPRG